MSELNFLHSFRDGNGRTQREYFRLLAMRNGYEIDWTKVDRETMLHASKKSVLDSKSFEPIFIATIVNNTPDRLLMKAFKYL